MSKRYNIDSPEYGRMQQNQHLFLMLSLGMLLLVAVGAFIGLSWYFFGQTGGMIAFVMIAVLAVGLVIWLMVMGSINSVSNIYRDAANTIVDFQAADDRGEVMRHMASVMKSDSQLDRSVLSLAGNLAKGHAKALVGNYNDEQRLLEQKEVEDKWYNVPEFEADYD